MFFRRRIETTSNQQYFYRKGREVRKESQNLSALPGTARQGRCGVLRGSKRNYAPENIHLRRPWHGNHLLPAKRRRPNAARGRC